MQTTRKPAAVRPAQAAGRYWKGKAPKGVDASALSDSDSDEAPQDVGEDQEAIEEEEFELAGQEEESKSNVRKGVAKMSVALRDVEVKDGKVIVGGQEEEEESEESEEEESKPKAPGEGSGSSEYESSSEEESEEEPPKPQFRPVFVPKRARETIKQLEAESEFSEESIKRREEEAAQRKKESHDMVAESIKRELAEKETAENVPDVDDTDGLDPAAEFEAWRSRELMRISREAEAARIREEERLERERRAALPEEQRLKEDTERAERSRADKPQGQQKQKFLQKYWHKGAFHQDAEILKRHDFTEATESTIDASLLPTVMQVKNFGKRGQTKYTHLRDQDTTVKQGEFGAAAVGKGPRPAGQAGVQEGCFNCGGPHLKRDCPNPPAPSGANASFGSRDAPAPKTWGAGRSTNAADYKGRSGQSWRDRDDNGRRDDDRRRDGPRDSRRGDDRDQSRRYDRSPRRKDRSPDRSRYRDDNRRRDYSPRRRDDDRRNRRDRDADDRRRRSRSREPRERSPPSHADRSDKRRRVEA